MAITQALCTSFKAELLNKEHDMNTDTFKIALFTSSVTLSAATTAYSSSNEISNASGSAYSAGGANVSETRQNHIQKVAFSSGTNTTDIGDLTMIIAWGNKGDVQY